MTANVAGTAELGPVLDEIERLLAAATPGPWTVSDDQIGGADLVQAADGQYIVDRLGALSRPDADLLAALRNHAPALLAAARRALP